MMILIAVFLSSCKTTNTSDLQTLPTIQIKDASCLTRGEKEDILVVKCVIAKAKGIDIEACPDDN